MMNFDYPKELVDYMLKQTTKTVLALVAVSVAFLLIYGPYLPPLYIGIWICSQAVFLILRLVNANMIEKSLIYGNKKSMQFQLFIFTVLMFLSAIIWSAGITIGASLAPAYFELISFIFVMGLLTGGIMSLSAIYPVYLLYFITLMGGQFIFMTKIDDTIYIDIIYLSLIYVPYILILSKTFNNKLQLTIEDNIHKDEDIYALNREIEDTQKEVVFTMGSIGEARSKETGNHVRRVAEYSKILALHYGLDKEDAEMLKQASPMHDIGKIAIPDAILHKPGPLNAEERITMNTHAQLGHDMLKRSERPLLKMAAIVSYEHHEKWDGSGYPNALKGEDINIYGRITALADVFDALGSRRSYKEAWELDDILSLFKEERGKHFDPKLVDIFFNNLDDFLVVRGRFID